VQNLSEGTQTSFLPYAICEHRAEKDGSTINTSMNSEVVLYMILSFVEAYEKRA
jgi:hypothetical protein